jgi:acetylornithine/N-succinyldiaminopimelate aminotransferase
MSAPDLLADAEATLTPDEIAAAVALGASAAPALPLPVRVPEQPSVIGSKAVLPTYKRAPFRLARGEGVTLYDDTNRGYLDFTSGIGVNALGYGDPQIVRAMQDAAEGLVHVSNMFWTSPMERLAEWLVERSFASSVFFCNSGAEANEGAFKFARKWAREAGGIAKHEILALRGSFHGRLFATLAATDRPQYRAPFRPLTPGVRVIEREVGDVLRALNRETTAAVIVEPVQGEGGVRVVDGELLRELRAATREVGAALIFDEIQCGLGRLGSLFAYEQTGVVPDIVTLAKPLAGGLPMGAILVDSEIASAIQYGDHGSTFGGGPFVASVALAVLERIGNPNLLHHVATTGAWFGTRLNALASQTGRVRAVRGAGFMWGVDVVEPAAKVVERAMDGGLLILTAGDYTLRLLPPLVSTRDELGRGLAILEEVLA